MPSSKNISDKGICMGSAAELVFRSFGVGGVVVAGVIGIGERVFDKR